MCERFDITMIFPAGGNATGAASVSVTTIITITTTGTPGGGTDMG
ncbi:hypothetical protein [Glycocaulis sp.]